MNEIIGFIVVILLIKLFLYRHNGRVFGCPLCASTMKLASSLLRHLRSIHPDRPDVAAKQAEEISRLYRDEDATATNNDDFAGRQDTDDYNVETEAAVQDISVSRSSSVIYININVNIISSMI